MTPGSPEWARIVTASKVAAILGLSPYESPRSLWHKMRGDVESEPQTKAQGRGHYLEPAILAWWRDQHPEFDVWQDQPTYTLEDWASATPDAVSGQIGAPCIVEAKSAARMDDWGEPGTDQIPDYYLTQVYWQLHLSKAACCYVPVIGPFLEFSEYVVKRDDEVGALLEAKCRAFYDSLGGDEPPPLDDSVATFNVIRRLHKDIERGESVELTEEEAYELAFYYADAKAAERGLRAAKSRVIDRMGRAQYATHQGVRIARRQPRGDDVTFVITARPDDLTQPKDAA